MRVGILGAGAIGFGMAAFLAKAGHHPTLWSPSGKRTEALAAGAPLVATRAIEGQCHPRIAATAAEAVIDQDAVVLTMPGNGHKAAMEALAPHLQPGQVVIISSHASFGALYLSRLLAQRGLSVPIVVWGTTLTTGRQSSNSEVTVNTVRQTLDIATVPASAIDVGHALCTTLFGDRFVRREGLLAIALSNLNPQNHMGIALCNLTRMERGETWVQAENITPAVGRLLEALDEERLAIAEAFGLKVRTIFEHFSLSFHVPMASVSEMNQAMFAAGRGGIGPSTLQNRYVLEDVPFGLVPTARLGALAGAPARLHESGIAIFGAAYGRDFAAENDLLPAVGLDGLGPADLKALTETGYTQETVGR